MWAAIPFFSALVLLVGFIAFHAWELSRGKRIFDSYRTKVDEKVSRLYHDLVVYEIPESWRIAVVVFLHKVTHQIVVVSVNLLQAIERPLSRLSNRMRTRPPSTEAGEVSQYLKNIVPDKKKNDSENSTTRGSGV